MHNYLMYMFPVDDPVKIETGRSFQCFNAEKIICAFGWLIVKSISARHN